MTDLVKIADGDLEAWFAPKGAELVRLRFRGQEQLWHGDPAWWDMRAPILFPVIGRSPGAAIKLAGKTFGMTPHGFARDRVFAIARHEAAQASFEQTDDVHTRAMYPFGFCLRIEAQALARGLEMAATIENRNATNMPFCFGYHPGFPWPQAIERRKRYVCIFERDETAPIRRADLTTGLLARETFASPVAGRTLALDDTLFERGALHFETVASRKVWFGVPGEAGLEVRFPDSPQLGIWTRPGAPFLCIEPWQGLAEVESSDGELERRPGVRVLAPGEAARYRLAVEFKPL
jgi:galactose mutarotase-like enzyme